jgi:hypothetical protein
MLHVTYLSDSTTAIWWIHGEPRNFQPFVANRVAEVISESDAGQWHHVRTDLNVADIAMRGVAANDLKPESRWINGPDFLKSHNSEWPIDDIPGPLSPTAQREMKKKVLRAKVVVPKLLDPAGYSNWLKLVRVTAWILRFCHNLRKKDRRNAEVLSVEELEEAELYWIKSAQQDRFGVEIESLSKGRPAAQASRIVDLNPQLVNGILRVGGRIDKAELPWEAKHPIILYFVKRDMSLRRRWRHSQFLADQFWRRWRQEYVPHLIKRSKWRTIQRNLRRGDLVLIVEDNVPGGQWRLGRVVAPIASADGLVRSAEIVTKAGTYVRPVGKLALLEAHHEEE